MTVAKGEKVDKPFRVLTNQVKLNEFEPIITMNHNNIGNINPVVLGQLKSTVTRVFTHVDIGDLGDDGAEAGIRVAGPASDDPIKLSYANSGTTARFSMTRLVKAHPGLKAPKLRVRVFPVSVKTVGSEAMLVLDLKGSYLEVVEIPEPKEKGEEEVQQAETQQKATKGKKAKTGAPEPVETADAKGSMGTKVAATAGSAKVPLPATPPTDVATGSPQVEVAAAKEPAPKGK